MGLPCLLSATIGPIDRRPSCRLVAQVGPFGA